MIARGSHPRHATSKSMLRRAASFARLWRHDVVHEDAHHISGHRRHQQHAIVRHGVAIVFGLLHAGDDVVRHRTQLDRGSLSADIGLKAGPAGCPLSAV